MNYDEYLGRSDAIKLRLASKLARLVGFLTALFFGSCALLALLLTVLLIVQEIATPIKFSLLAFLIAMTLSIMATTILFICTRLADNLLSKSSIKIKKAGDIAETGRHLRDIIHGSWLTLLAVAIIAAMYSTSLPKYELKNNHEAIIFWFVLASYAIFHFYFFATTRRIMNKLLSNQYTTST